jgi:predicted AlkP superfamily phosphohydrolase/phosphomutase
MAKQVLVIGLDGATWRIMEPLMAAGRLPNLQRLMARGSSGALESIIPPQTGPAWVSFMTGRNPGQHGVYYFKDFDLNAYGARGSFVTSARYKGKTLFDELSRRGHRVAAVRVPMTYPAWPINGVMVSGYPSPDNAPRYVTPASLAGVIPPLGSLPAMGSPEKQLDALLVEVRETTQIAEQLLRSEGPFDLFMVVYQQLDQAHHIFWRFLDGRRPGSPPGAQASGNQADYIGRCYEVVDAGVGHLLERVNAEVPVVVLSDHGAAPAPRYHVNTNLWLRQQGLLAARHTKVSLARRLYDFRHLVVPAGVKARLRTVLHNRLPQAMRDRMDQFIFNVDDVDWGGTKAYRFPVPETLDAIAINLRGRQPQGIVEPGDEYERVLTEILGRLPSLVDPRTGGRIVQEAWRREDIYSGPFLDQAPDIIMRLHPDYEPGQVLVGDLVTPVPSWELEAQSGTHEPEGILIAAGTPIKMGHHLEGANLLDVTPTLWALLGMEPPADLEGHVLADLFAEPTDAVSPRTDVSDGTTAEDGQGEGWLSAEEQEIIEDRLRALGYI